MFGQRADCDHSVFALFCASLRSFLLFLPSPLFELGQVRFLLGDPPDCFVGDVLPAGGAQNVPVKDALEKHCTSDAKLESDHTRVELEREQASQGNPTEPKARQGDVGCFTLDAQSSDWTAQVDLSRVENVKYGEQLDDGACQLNHVIVVREHPSHFVAEDEHETRDDQDDDSGDFCDKFDEALAQCDVVRSDAVAYDCADGFGQAEWDLNDEPADRRNHSLRCLLRHAN